MATKTTNVRQHRSDIMSPETRSALMSRIRGKDTGPERAVATMLQSMGLSWDSHARDLPGRPDFVLRDHRAVILVDGDFWHGWNFPRWRNKLSEDWERKIDANRKRDQRNIRKLRRQGWLVIRIWEHQLKRNPEQCTARIADALRRGKPATVR